MEHLKASPEADELEILYLDQYIVAVYKPEGLLVHRSKVDKYESRFLLQTLREQLGQRVYPLHRLDKPTSGVILFALDSEVAALAQSKLQSDSAQKSYLLVCRGHCPVSGVIDQPLRVLNDFKKKNAVGGTKRYRDDKCAQTALTIYKRLHTIEIDAAVDKYPTSRYALVEASIKTGRKHQIRRHFKHIAHPIIGCPKYGKSKHNLFFKERYGVSRLLLHAHRLELAHPVNGASLSIVAEPKGQFHQLLQAFAWG